MTELEKLDAGLEYDFWDEGVNERKLRAIRVCQKLNAMPQEDEAAREPVIRELLGAAGENPSVGPNFQCDYGLHITVGKNFLANYNVTILDIAPVKIGDYVMIGPNTLITTVGHPLSPLGRRKHLGKAEPVIRELLGSVGENPSIGPNFQCDYGLHITVGENFLTNYNVTILDIAPVKIGDYVMIGPNTLITTVGHPLSPLGRRKHLGQAKPVTIGDDVWIGGNVTILPGVTIGSNVVVAAGAVVTKDVPNNCVVGGVPARVLRELENDVEDENAGGICNVH